MNLPTLIVLLLVAVALFLALRAYLRAGRSGGCSCGSSGCSGCAGGPTCPHCKPDPGGKSLRTGR